MIPTLRNVIFWFHIGTLLTMKLYITTFQYPFYLFVVQHTDFELSGTSEHFITFDPRLPFPDSVGGIFPVLPLYSGY